MNSHNVRDIQGHTQKNETFCFESHLLLEIAVITHEKSCHFNNDPYNVEQRRDLNGEIHVVIVDVLRATPNQNIPSH